MPARKGICPNFTNCPIADSKDIIEVQPGAEYVCTECNAKLSPAPAPPPDRRWMAIPAALIVVILGGITWFFLQPKAPPFVNGQNSIGMQFVELPSTGIYWSIWDTRVSDFSAFIQEHPESAPAEMVSLVAGKDQDTGNSWRAVGRSWNQPEFEQSDNHPVVGVSFGDAQAFCAWLNQKERRQLNKSHFEYRLPTAEEWKMAAAYEGLYPWGNDWSALVTNVKPAGNFAGSELRGDPLWPVEFKTIANYSDGWKRTSPVGSYAPNRYGLFDMCGNVSAWCSTASNAGTEVVCGGSWCSQEPEDLAATTPPEELPSDTRNSRIGFRVVAVPQK